MSKPSTFQAQYIVMKHTSYRAPDDARKAGPLHIGRVVWLNGEVSPDAMPDAVTAYVEPVGLVQIDPHCLKSTRAMASL